MGMSIEDIIQGLKETNMICNSVFAYDRKKYIDGAIDKLCKYQMMQADYEARLRADMMTMLEEIQLEIADNVESIIGHYDASTPERKRPLCKSARNEGRTECIDVIQQKINSLKEAAT